MTEQDSHDPDWGTALTLTLTPNGISQALFWSASAVHTGWSSCIDKTMVTADLYAVDGEKGNYCRLAEQEFAEEDNEDVLWHDWVVEVRIGSVYVTGHWQTQVNAPLSEWDWCQREAELAFERACVLFGKRTRRGIVVEEGSEEAPPPKRTAH
ncbi:MAG: hypothetical protein MUE39_00445 [Gammaproteobacteria bacterium]|jgi:hypothetical protein|nr:hypothetical protein [Gammaproteobacteria bacterium]